MVSTTEEIASILARERPEHVVEYRAFRDHHGPVGYTCVVAVVKDQHGRYLVKVLTTTKGERDSYAGMRSKEFDKVRESAEKEISARKFTLELTPSWVAV